MKQSSNDYHDKSNKVDPSDGISKEEAIIIAQNYMVNHEANGSFVLSKPKVTESTLIKGCWTVSFPRNLKETLEYGPLWETLEVDKQTGKIRASGGSPDL